MRKIKEVLRLRFELGLGQRAIARACSISQSTVHEYLKRAEVAKIPWPLPEGWDQERVEKVLFGEPRSIEQCPERVRPDFPVLHAQLQQHPHLTLQLAWEESFDVRRNSEKGHAPLRGRRTALPRVQRQETQEDQGSSRGDPPRQDRQARPRRKARRKCGAARSTD
jgi:hypothetical protein